MHKCTNFEFVAHSSTGVILPRSMLMFMKPTNVCFFWLIDLLTTLAPQLISILHNITNYETFHSAVKCREENKWMKTLYMWDFWFIYYRSANSAWARTEKDSGLHTIKARGRKAGGVLWWPLHCKACIWCGWHHCVQWYLPRPAGGKAWVETLHRGAVAHVLVCQWQVSHASKPASFVHVQQQVSLINVKCGHICQVVKKNRSINKFALFFVVQGLCSQMIHSGDTDLLWKTFYARLPELLRNSPAPMVSIKQISSSSLEQQALHMQILWLCWATHVPTNSHRYIIPYDMSLPVIWLLWWNGLLEGHSKVMNTLLVFFFFFFPHSTINYYVLFCIPVTSHQLLLFLGVQTKLSFQKKTF